MDEMSEIVGTSANSLDKDEVRGEVLDNYIACTSFLVCSSSFSSSFYLFIIIIFLILCVLHTSLATMKAKKCR